MTPDQLAKAKINYVFGGPFVTDSDGNQYYEVDHLTQDIIFKHIKNNSSDS